MGGSLELGGGPRVSQGLVGGPTSRWGRVKTTGSMRKTRLDSLLMEAAMTWELTTRGGGAGPHLSPQPHRRVSWDAQRPSPKHSRSSPASSGILQILSNFPIHLSTPRTPKSPQ
uniref:Uncharacterized protein n=1 Tax=Aquila chrysaetos chrysaetos TaxID=223781 RepID=A0A663FG79_AQUCH